MKVLSIEQMNQLKELGVDVEPNGLDFMYSTVVLDEYRLMYAESVCEDDMKAFNLQDVIELLPYEIKYDGHCCKVLICPSCNFIMYDKIIYDNTRGIYESDTLVIFKDSNILDAAYNMLIWVIENGYLKTK